MSKSLKELTVDQAKAALMADLDTERIIEDGAYMLNAAFDVLARETTEPTIRIADVGPSTAEQANADFYYRLGAETQLEAVGEDELTEHYNTLPIHDQLVRDHRSVELQMVTSRIAQHAEKVERRAAEELASFATDATPSVWDQCEEWLESLRRAYKAYAWGLALAGALSVVGWLALASA